MMTTLQDLVFMLCGARGKDPNEIIAKLDIAIDELQKKPSLKRCEQLSELFNTDAASITQMKDQFSDDINTKHYTVCFLFDENLNHVLLLRKMKTKFVNLLNGIGGAIRPNEHPMLSALRKIQEETGVHANDITNFGYLGTLILPTDCSVTEANNTKCVLHYFTGVIDKDKPCPQPGEPELLEWHNTNYVRGMSLTSAEKFFAGNGNLQLFVHMGIAYHIDHKSIDAYHQIQKEN